MGHLWGVAVRILKRPGTLISVLLLVLLGSAFLTQVVPYRQIVDSQRQVAEAQAHLDQLVAENDRLTADVAALETDAEIERLAREKLGYVRPGEVAYVVLEPPEADPAPAPPEPVPEPVDRTWVEAVWDFLTGADVES